MIALTPQLRILVARETIDFRKGIDGMARICRSELKSDPFSGTVFVFRNRNKTAIKLLVYDGQGFWLCHKRLSSGSFSHWPNGEEAGSALLAQELQVILAGGNPGSAQLSSQWRKIIN
jgi:transposase